MKKTIIAALLCAPLLAHAWQFEGGIGNSNFNQGPDGRWVVDGNGFKNSTKLSSTTLSFGVTGEFSSWLAWHADYVFLGSASSNAFVPGAQTNTTSGTWQGPDLVGLNRNDPCSGPCNNLQHFVGSGNIQGLALTLEPYHEFSNGVRLGVEAGPYIYHYNWRVTAYNWVGSAEDTPHTINVHNTKPVNIGAVVGANVTYNNVTLAYRHYFLMTPKNNVPAIWNGADVLELKVRF